MVEVKRAYRNSQGTLTEGSTVATIGYDGLNRRIVKDIDNSGDWDCAYHYYYSGQRMIETRNGSDNVLKQHVWGAGYVDELVQIAINDDPTNGDDCWMFYWAMQDANYNVLGVASYYCELVERYEYTPYGQRQVYTFVGTNYPIDPVSPLLESKRVEVSTVKQPYGLCDIGHQGLMHDKEFDLIHNRARYLIPHLGRWNRFDPIGYPDGMNGHEYCGSNPIVFVDPNGLWKILRNKYLKRARAIAEKGDTIKKLTKLVKLEPSEWKRWVEPFVRGTVATVDGSKKISALKEGTEICPGTSVTIPNVVAIVYGHDVKGSWHPLSIFNAIESDLELLANQARKNKFHVMIKIFPGSGEIEDWLSRDDLHGFAFGGHGDRQGIGILKAEKKPEKATPPGLWVHHKIAFMLLLSCYSAAPDVQQKPYDPTTTGGRTDVSEWEVNVSSKGVFGGFTGGANIWNAKSLFVSRKGGVQYIPVLKKGAEKRRAKREK